MFLLKLIPPTFRGLSRITPKLAAKLGIELLFRPRKSARTADEQLFWSTGLPVTFASGCRGRIFGEGQSAVCVVHGWQSRGSKFQSYVESCLKLGHQVIVWDGPAHGDSPGNRTNLAAFSRMLHQDLVTLDKNWSAIIGHSFGAAAAAYVCSLGLNVKQLVLIAAPSSARGVFERFWKLIGLGPAAHPHFINLVETEVKITVDDMSSIEFINKLPQKVLVFHDRGDRLIPVTDAFALKEKRNDIDLVITESLGHFKIVQSAAVVDRVAQFVGLAAV